MVVSSGVSDKIIEVKIEEPVQAATWWGWRTQEHPELQSLVNRPEHLSANSRLFTFEPDLDASQAQFLDGPLQFLTASTGA